MLTIARTLMGNPSLLLLDEPSDGLAPLVVEHLTEQIARLKREGLTILLAAERGLLSRGGPRLRPGEGHHPLPGTRARVP
jgi:branched-chain amino acid transport system ATP-binding protein